MISIPLTFSEVALFVSIETALSANNKIQAANSEKNLHYANQKVLVDSLLSSFLIFSQNSDFLITSKTPITSMPLVPETMNGIRLFFKNGCEEVRTVCFKTAARSRIPAAESGRETTTTFRLPEESVPCSSPRQDPGPGLERVRRVANPEARAQRAGASLHLGPGGQETRRGGSLAKAEGAGTARQRSSEGQWLS